MSTKHTKTFKAFQDKHNLSYQNFFTFTNPKVLKNEKISEIPTAVLMLMNTPVLNVNLDIIILKINLLLILILIIIILLQIVFIIPLKLLQI